MSSGIRTACHRAVEVRLFTLVPSDPHEPQLDAARNELGVKRGKAVL
jgi:hypothetical protein